GIRKAREISVDLRRDVDGERLDTRSRDHQVGVLQALSTRGFVGHLKRKDILRPQGRNGKEGAQRRVYPAGEADHDPLQADFADLVGNKGGENFLEQRGVGGNASHAASMAWERGKRKNVKRKE